MLVLADNDVGGRCRMVNDIRRQISVESELAHNIISYELLYIS
jgi:hypothetical protein